MSKYFVSRHSYDAGVQKFGLTVENSHGSLSAGSVIMTGDDIADVRTAAGAKCFRGTESYDVRVAAVRKYLGEGHEEHFRGDGTMGGT